MDRNFQLKLHGDCWVDLDSDVRVSQMVARGCADRFNRLADLGGDSGGELSGDCGMAIVF